MDHGRSALLHLVDRLRRVDSWTGRTHIQKCVFLLRELYSFDLGYEYVLYKHGPYSFELDAEIEGLRIVDALDYEIVMSEYGPRYMLGPVAATLKEDLPPELETAIGTVAAAFGKSHVKDLECISTLVYCRRTQPQGTPPSEIKSCVKGLKPHLSEEDIDTGWSLLAALGGNAKWPGNEVRV